MGDIMRLILIILFATMMLIIGDAIAQFKPSDQQYLTKENLAVNGGFEQGKRGWTNSAGTFSIDNTKEVIGKNAGCITLTAQTLDFSQTLSTGYNTNLSGLQGEVSAYIRSTSPNVEVCSLVDGAEQTCTNVKNNSAYDFYQIPTVLGSTSIGFKVKTSGNETGEICLDDVTFGAKDITQPVGEAQYVGKVVYAESACQWTVTQGSYGDFPVDPQCIATITQGNVSQPDTRIPAVKILNARTDGTYKVVSNGVHFSNGLCYYNLSETSSKDNSNASVNIFSPDGDRSWSLEGTFKFSTTGDKTIRTINFESGGDQSCGIIGDNVQSLTYSVMFYPDSGSTIVAQKNSLSNVSGADNGGESITALVTNITFNEEVDDSGNWNGSEFTADRDMTVNLSGSIRFTAGAVRNVYVYKDTGGGYAQDTLVSKDVSISQSTKPFAGIVHLNKGDKFALRVTSNGGTLQTGQNNLHWIKIIEHNTSPTIIGKFEEIDTSDLVEVQSYNTSNTTPVASGGILFFPDEVKDPFNAWNGSVFTSPKDTCYDVSGHIAFTTGGVFRNVSVYNSGGTSILRLSETNDQSNSHFEGKFCLAESEQITFRVNSNGGTPNALDRIFNIYIQEMATTQSIIKNLNDVSFFKTKCQQKFLAANYTSGNTVDLVQMRFNNLTIGKIYSYQQHTSAGGSVTYAVNGGTQLIAHGVNLSPFSSVSGTGTIYFTATGTTLNYGVSNNSVGSPLFGDGTGNQSFHVLCEMPESFSLTTDFN